MATVDRGDLVDFETFGAGDDRCVNRSKGHLTVPTVAQWRFVADLVVVVGAALVDGGRLLAAQRAGPPALAGRWELSGGKVDPGESDEDALVRECREELGAEVRLRERLGGDWPLGDRVVMRVWLAEIVRGSVRPLEHRALRWLAPEELFDVDWLSADLPIVEALRDRLDGGSSSAG